MDSCVSDGQSVVYIRSNSVRPRVSSYISFFTHYQFILTRVLLAMLLSIVLKNYADATSGVLGKLS